MLEFREDNKRKVWELNLNFNESFRVVGFMCFSQILIIRKYKQQVVSCNR